MAAWIKAAVYAPHFPLYATDQAQVVDDVVNHLHKHRSDYTKDHVLISSRFKAKGPSSASTAIEHLKTRPWQDLYSVYVTALERVCM
jgi:hypothetical protein